MSTDTIGARMWKARKAAGISQVEISEILGIFPNNISRFENDQQDVKSKHITLFCKHLNINPTWLIMGTGPMLLEDENKDHNVVNDLRASYGPLFKIDATGLQQKFAEIDQAIKALEAKLN